MKKILLGAIIVVLLVGIGLFGLIFLASDHEIPSGESGPAAEALRDRIEQAINLPGWRNLAAVEFTFKRTGNRHFYDKHRRLVEVAMGDTVVQFDAATYRYRALKGGSPLGGPEADAAFAKAMKSHVNDTFWLNPFAQMRAPGVRLEKIGEMALLVAYTSGGVTPGDSYLFVTNETGRPTHVKMWVSVIPIKGIEFSFENWQEFAGVPLSLSHHSFVADTDIENVVVHPAYPEAGRPDRFAELVGL